MHDDLDIKSLVADLRVVRVRYDTNQIKDVI